MYAQGNFFYDVLSVEDEEGDALVAPSGLGDIATIEMVQQCCFATKPIKAISVHKFLALGHCQKRFTPFFSRNKVHDLLSRRQISHTCCVV